MIIELNSMLIVLNMNKAADQSDVRLCEIFTRHLPDIFIHLREGGVGWD